MATYWKGKMNYNKKPGRPPSVVGSTFGRTITCSHCGRQCGNFAGGHSRGLNGAHLCHPNAKNRPNCYQLVTVHGHETPCKNKTCYEDHPELLTYINNNKKPRKVRNALAKDR